GDGRTIPAEFVGSDPDTDIALMRIQVPKDTPLAAIALADSSQLQVGDFVVAVGNPFGLGQSVTSGIVSALGRSGLRGLGYQNFIQTDASINPGNSGGALVDVNGNLLGINTAIYSRTGGSLGIGFAVPVSTAKLVMEGLVRDGQVTRGWIGVEPRDLTPEIAETFNLPIKQGVLITGVLQNGPASAAGLRPGDVVVKVADTPVANTVQLLAAVAALKPQTPAVIGIQRGDKALDLNVTVAQRPRTQPRREQ
ncbi:MAG TPA: trypsin-like peptidase domain-containing protein, partial [Rhizobacter sp.]|nr:trypsin-like peptidase domain-containing protein [Rhizobacter sp.]